MILADPKKIADLTNRGWWGTRTLQQVFLQNAERDPEREAFVDASNRSDFMEGAPRRLSYRQLREEIERASVVLRSHGLQKDDVLCVQLPNCAEQLSIYIACAQLGIIVTPVLVQYREHELDYILRHTHAKAVLTATHIAGFAHVSMFLALRAQLPQLRTIFAIGSAIPAGAVAFDQQLQAVSSQQRDLLRTSLPSIDANEIFTICWTSGTEARPKGVPRSHNEWFAQGRLAVELARLETGARLLNPFPMVNMAGFSTALVPWLWTAGTIVQHQPFKLPVFLQQLRDEAIDYTIAAPAILNRMLQNEELLQGIDFKRLWRIGSGAAPLSGWMVRGFEEKYGVRILNNYGSNEGGVLLGSDLDIPDPELRASCFSRIGVPGFQWTLPQTGCVRTRLVDLESEQDIEQPGAVGELRFAGATVFAGYFEAPEITAAAFDQQGYYRSGDLFEIAGARQQYYRYVGRAKDIVIRGGMNISSEEIEGLLLAHPRIAEVAIVGYPDAELGERVCACVVAKPGQTVTLEDIAGFLRDEQRTAVFKLPERLVLLDELPRNPVGKVLKRELRAHLNAPASGANS